MTLAYALRVALRSLRRDPGHTAIMVIVFALGLAAWTSARAAQPRIAGGDEADRHLYFVELTRPADTATPAQPYDPPEDVAYLDRALLASDTPTRKTDLFVGSGVARTAEGHPITVDVAFGMREGPAMFHLPLRAGGPWSEPADRGEERVVILGDAANRALFGGGDSVGRSVRIYGDDFRVVAIVAAPAAPAASAPRRPLVILPSALAGRYHVRPSYFRPHGAPAPSREGFLASESTWIELWVELHGDQRARYEAELAAYVRDQRARGRPLTGARLIPRADVQRARAFDPGAMLFNLFAVVLLGSAVLHVVRLLDAKRRATGAETAVQRAFGASRRAVFFQQLLQAELVALVAGVVALGINAVAFPILNHVILVRQTEYRLDASSVAITLAGAALLGALAGVYPAARAATSAPAEALRGAW